MNSFVFSLLMGGPPGDPGGGGMVMQFIPFAMIIAIFYFLIIRPQSKKQKETQRMLGALKKGDKVATIGGIHGVIQSVKETTVIVKVDEYTKIEFSRSAIAGVIDASKEDKSAEDKGKPALLKDKDDEKPRETEKKRFGGGLFGKNSADEDKD